MSSTDHSIPLAEAAKLTKKFREENPSEIKSGKFSKAAVDALFSDPLATSMRIYYGKTSAGENTLVLVGVDAAGNDLYTGYLADRMDSDPPFSSSPNPLNT